MRHDLSFFVAYVSCCIAWEKYNYIVFICWLNLKLIGNNTLHQIGVNYKVICVLKYVYSWRAIEQWFLGYSNRVFIYNVHFQFFKNLPWFSYTVVEPMQANNLRFESDKFILNVDCPILIIHAEDDKVVPYKLGRKVCNILISYWNCKANCFLFVAL